MDFQKQYLEEKSELLPAIECVLYSGDFILGAEVEAFEKDFADYVGVKHAIGVGNGTDSLILMLKALNIGPGDEVITAPNSWISSASSIALCGATPVFVDIDDDMTLDPALIAEKITKRTKAIMPVHLTGRLAKMREILKIGEDYGIPVIEDAAQAVGARRDGHVAGRGGIMASFSLHPLKNLNGCGDGGIITTNDESLANSLRLWRNHGLITRDWHHQWGYNSRLDTIQAAILRIRLRHLDRNIEKRRLIAQEYFVGLQKYVDCPRADVNDYHTYHTFIIRAMDRDDLRKRLTEKGIETKIHYPTPIHLQPAASALPKDVFPECEAQAEEILSLPIHQYLTLDEIKHVIDSIRGFYR